MLDILESRYKTRLIDYFLEYTKEERSRVKYFVMDMWKDYKSIAWLFPNAQIVVDKYHYIRQVYWALDNVRKRVQREFERDKRKYFKRSKKLLFAPFDKLSEENKLAVMRMLDQHSDLVTAWSLKESFLIAKNSGDDTVLRNWILSCEDSGLDEFRACTTAFHNWSTEIHNSLKCSYTNGFTEGCNNKIKVLKRIRYGFRNFDTFRNKILHTFKFAS